MRVTICLVVLVTVIGCAHDRVPTGNPRTTQKQVNSEADALSRAVRMTQLSPRPGSKQIVKRIVDPKGKLPFTGGLFKNQPLWQVEFDAAAPKAGKEALRSWDESPRHFWVYLDESTGQVAGVHAKFHRGTQSPSATIGTAGPHPEVTNGLPTREPGITLLAAIDSAKSYTDPYLAKKLYAYYMVNTDKEPARTVWILSLVGGPQAPFTVGHLGGNADAIEAYERSMAAHNRKHIVVDATTGKVMFERGSP